MAKLTKPQLTTAEGAEDGLSHRLLVEAGRAPIYLGKQSGKMHPECQKCLNPRPSNAKYWYLPTLGKNQN